MRNPYSFLPDHAFWRRSISSLHLGDVDPVTSIPFKLAQSDRIATIGSCFAQHISNTIVREGYNYLVTERAPSTPHAMLENFGVYPARFGNVYTTRQFLQLVQRAYGLFEPADAVWRRPDGEYIDPFRPQIQKAGFPSEEAVHADRRAHLACVRRMFEEADVLVFTLGLTETWIADGDGAAVPTAPGVVGESVSGASYHFMNAGVADMMRELTFAFEMIREVNPDLRFILTVSPVPLIATYSSQHVLTATTYSKSALRVVSEEMTRLPGVAYFPSYEIIMGSFARAAYFQDDLREVRPEGVAHVMSVFRRHYLGSETVAEAAVAPPAPKPAVAPAPVLAATPAPPAPPAASAAPRNEDAAFAELQAIICDEEILDRR